MIKTLNHVNIWGEKNQLRLHAKQYIEHYEKYILKKNNDTTLKITRNQTTKTCTFMNLTINYDK